MVTYLQSGLSFVRVVVASEQHDSLEAQFLRTEQENKILSEFVSKIHVFGKVWK